MASWRGRFEDHFAHVCVQESVCDSGVGEVATVVWGSSNFLRARARWTLVGLPLLDGDIHNLRLDDTDNVTKVREESIGTTAVKMNAFRCLRVVVRPAITSIRPSLTHITAPQRYLSPYPSSPQPPLTSPGHSNPPPAPSPSSHRAGPCSPRPARSPPPAHPCSSAAHQKPSTWWARSPHTRAWAACRSAAGREIRTTRAIWCASGDMGF